MATFWEILADSVDHKFSENVFVQAMLLVLMSFSVLLSPSMCPDDILFG